MEVTVEEVNSLTRKLRIVLPAEEVAKEFDSAYRKLKSEVKLKGFRRGKVPRSILEKNYGPRIKAEVGEKLVQATYFDAVEREMLDVVAHPDIKTHTFGDDGTFCYEAEVETRPQFELKKYKGLEIEKNEPKVSDSEVEAELARLQKEMAPLRSVEDRAIALNDISIVDFQGYHDGERIPQVRGENVSIDVGSGRNGKEFEQKLIGLKKGDESRFEIEFPPTMANPVLAGKKVDFEIAVKDVKERVLADLDDEFARDIDGDFDSLDKLKAHIREKILKGKEEAAKGDLSDKIMQALITENHFEVPSRLVQYEINDYIKQTEERLKANGLNLESAGLNRDEMAEHYREAAEKRVRGDFILKEIAELEKIKLEEADINNGFGRIAEQYNMTVDEVKGFFKRREDMLPLLNELLNEKILKFLGEEAVFTVVTDRDQSSEEIETEEKEAGEQE